MMARRCRGLALLLLMAGGFADGAFAQPRGAQVEVVPLTPEQQEARRLQQVADMDTWLRRLVGRFRIEGVFQVDHPGEPLLTSAKGMADCVAVGAGAGVQCVINVTWVELVSPQNPGAPGEVSWLEPAMLEYGLDPVAARVRYLQVDNQSLAEGTGGVLKGDVLTTRVRCANSDAKYLCERVTRIRASPDSKYLALNIDMERNRDRMMSLSVDLRRVAADETGKGPADPRQSRPAPPSTAAPPLRR